MKTFVCVCKGLTPLLQHRFAEEAEIEQSTRKIHIQNVDPRQAAEKAAYRTNEGHLWMPGASIARLLREAGGSHKQRGSRKSLKFVVPAAVLVTEDQIILRDEEGTPLDDFEVDSRPVVIPATKGRVMRHRPRLNAWNIEFSIEIDDEILEPQTIHQLLTEGGQRIGIGDYRPEKGGPFGRFAIVSWAELAAPKLLEAAE